MGELTQHGGEGGRPAKKVPGKKAAKKAAVKKTPAKKAAKKTSGKKAAKKASAKKAGKKAAKKASARKAADASAGNAARSRTDAPKMRAIPAPPTDPLLVLGLDSTFTRAELRRAWLDYAARHHPDKGGDGSTFARGRAAYEVLRTLLEQRG